MLVGQRGERIREEYVENRSQEERKGRRNVETEGKEE